MFSSSKQSHVVDLYSRQGASHVFCTSHSHARTRSLVSQYVTKYNKTRGLTLSVHINYYILYCATSDFCFPCCDFFNETKVCSICHAIKASSYQETKGIGRSKIQEARSPTMSCPGSEDVIQQVIVIYFRLGLVPCSFSSKESRVSRFLLVPISMPFVSKMSPNGVRDAKAPDFLISVLI